MTIQSTLKCICHIHSQLIWRITSKAVIQFSKRGVCAVGRRHLPTLHRSGPHLCSSRILKKQKWPWWRISWEELPQFLHSTTACVYGKGVGDAAQRESWPQPTVPHYFLLIPHLFDFSKQVLTAGSICKAWLFQQTTSDPHKHFVINLYISKKSIYLTIDSGLLLQQITCSSSLRWPQVPGITRTQRMGRSTSWVTWHYIVKWYCVPHSYKVQIVCTGTLFSQIYGWIGLGLSLKKTIYLLAHRIDQTLLEISMQIFKWQAGFVCVVQYSLQPLVPGFGTSKYIWTLAQYSNCCVSIYEVCQGLHHRPRQECHRDFLRHQSTELMPECASAGAKKGRHSLSLDLRCSSVLLHLPYPGHTGQSKCLCIRTSVWGQQEGNSIFFVSNAVNTLVWLQLHCHLCPSVSELCWAEPRCGSESGR